jgi:hypothetical protein
LGFCTIACSTNSDCGSGAVCVQNALGKGCVPTSCQFPDAGGGDSGGTDGGDDGGEADGGDSGSVTDAADGGD